MRLTLLVAAAVLMSGCANVPFLDEAFGGSVTLDVQSVSYEERRCPDDYSTRHPCYTLEVMVTNTAGEEVDVAWDSWEVIFDDGGQYTASQTNRDSIASDSEGMVTIKVGAVDGTKPVEVHLVGYDLESEWTVAEAKVPASLTETLFKGEAVDLQKFKAHISPEDSIMSGIAAVRDSDECRGAGKAWQTCKAIDVHILNLGETKYEIRPPTYGFLVGDDGYKYTFNHYEGYSVTSYPDTLNVMTGYAYIDEGVDAFSVKFDSYSKENFITGEIRRDLGYSADYDGYGFFEKIQQSSTCIKDNGKACTTLTFRLHLSQSARIAQSEIEIVDTNGTRYAARGITDDRILTHEGFIDMSVQFEDVEFAVKTIIYRDGPTFGKEDLVVQDL